MTMMMDDDGLDFVLVPLGLGLMVAYHIWLAYRVVVHPKHTVIGINAINRQLWVKTMMEVSSLSFSLSLSVALM